MENILLLIVGVILAVIGIINMTGNVSSIHSYNRRKVKEEDIPKYGRAVGLGTLIIGLGIIANAVILLMGLPDVSAFVLIPTLAIGLGLILYGQFKYNKGIF